MAFDSRVLPGAEEGHGAPGSSGLVSRWWPPSRTEPHLQTGPGGAQARAHATTANAPGAQERTFPGPGPSSGLIQSGCVGSCSYLNSGWGGETAEGFQEGGWVPSSSQRSVAGGQEARGPTRAAQGCRTDFSPRDTAQGSAAPEGKLVVSADK